MPKERLLHDPEKVKQAVWKNQQENESWKFHQRIELGNRMVDLFYSRLINGVLRPGEPPLPRPILGIEVLPYKQCGHFKLTEDAYGNKDVIITNARHIEFGDYEYGETLLHEVVHLHFEHVDPEMNRTSPHGKRFQGMCERFGLHVNDKGQHTRQADGVFKDLMAELGIRPPILPPLPPEHKGSYFLPPKMKGRSTLSLWQCGCEPPQKVRVGRDTLHARCTLCELDFRKVE